MTNGHHAEKQKDQEQHTSQRGSSGDVWSWTAHARQQQTSMATRWGYFTWLLLLAWWVVLDGLMAMGQTYTGVVLGGDR